jgi:hypothetical protein
MAARVAGGLFRRGDDGQYYLDYGRLTSTDVDQSYLAAVRRDLDPEKLRAYGWDGGEISDKILELVVVSGIVVCPAFLDAIEDHLTPAPCLCCYRASKPGLARAVEEQIRLIRRYFVQAEYERSNLFYRTLCGFMRDVSDFDARAVANHLRRIRGESMIASRLKQLGLLAFETHSPNTPAPAEASIPAPAEASIPAPAEASIPAPAEASTSEKDQKGELCAQGIAVYVYSTDRARKIMRRISKACAPGMKISVKVSEDSVGELFALRHKYRVYTLECFYKSGEGGDARADLEAAIKRVVRNSRKRRPN